MNEKCKAAFEIAGYWPNEVMWKAWQQSWAASEAYKDEEIKKLRDALEYACCGIDTADADIERDCIDKARECLTRHSMAAEKALRDTESKP